MIKHLGILLCSLCVLVIGGYYLAQNTSFYKKNNEVKNYLLDESFYDNIDFNLISDEDYLPAISQAAKEAKKNIQAIFDNNESPTFLNTIVALEESKVLLDRLSDILTYLVDVKGNEKISEAFEAVKAKKLRFNTKVFHNKKFFERVKFVYDNQNSFDLDEMDKILLENTYQTFMKEGINLNEEDQKTLNKINRKLSKLESKFIKQLQKQKDTFEYNIPEEKIDPTMFKGVSDTTIKSLQEAAKGYKHTGYSFTYSNPEIGKIVRDAEDRSLRKKVYNIFKAEGKIIDSTLENIAEGPNAKIVVKIANLRLKRAKLLGFKNHAEYTLKNTSMAQTPERVLKFINEILPYALEARAKDLKAIEDYAREIEHDDKFKLKPWDRSYYSKKLKEKKYNINIEELEEYFKLSNVREGVFNALKKLYGVSITKKENPSLYYKEDNKDGEKEKIVDGIEEFEVKDKNGEFLGRLYIDYFARSGKNGGAQATSLKEGYAKLDKDGKVIGYNTPVVVVAFNFSSTLKEENNKQTISAEDSILLTLDEVETFFHEMGHAINGFLIRSKYNSLSFLRSYIDFAELPSQFFENWAFHKEHVYSYARHYKDTNKIIPEEFVDSIKRSKNFNEGIFVSGQMFLNLLDMGWHTIEKRYTGTATNFEKKVFSKAKIKLKDEEIPSTSAFAHIMHHEYDAKYYSYMWSLMLAEDAFELFDQKGIFDQGLANSFRENILSVVSSSKLNEYYRKFRGKDPDSKALMRSFGFIK